VLVAWPGQTGDPTEMLATRQRPTAPQRPRTTDRYHLSETPQLRRGAGQYALDLTHLTDDRVRWWADPLAGYLLVYYAVRELSVIVRD
jgi:hypothetical protein